MMEDTPTALRLAQIRERWAKARKGFVNAHANAFAYDDIEFLLAALARAEQTIQAMQLIIEKSDESLKHFAWEAP